MEGHLVQRGKAKTWYLVYDEPAALGQPRKQRWIRLGRMSEAEAHKQKRKLLCELDEKGFAERPPDMTVAKLIETWLADRSSELATKTHERYESLLRRHVTPRVGDLPVAQLQPSHIADIYRRMRSGGYSGQTCLHVHRALHTALGYGMKTLRVVKENVASHVPAPRVRARDTEPMSEERIRMILAATKGTRLEVPVLVAVLTGLRRGELLALRWRNVDLQRKQLTISEALEHTRTYGVRFKPPKSRSSRRVLPIPDVLVAALEGHRETMLRERERLGPAFTDLDLVFCNPDGSFWPPDTFSKQFAGLVGPVGLKGFRFHDVRHAFATLTLRNGVSVKEVSTLLGHASPTLTLSTYAHAMEGLGRQAVNGLAESLLASPEVTPAR